MILHLLLPWCNGRTIIIIISKEHRLKPCLSRTPRLQAPQPKKGIHLTFVPAKLMPTWLAQVPNLIDFITDRKVMQLRYFYAHAGVSY